MRLFTALAFYLVYWLICYICTGTDRKNLAGLRSYPDAVQRAVRAHPTLGAVVPDSAPVGKVLAGNVVLFTGVFSVLGLALRRALGLADFGAAFWFFLALGEGLGAFDLVVIDLIWWRNTRRIRFSILPERENYQNPKRHIASFLRGIPMFALVAALAAFIVSAL